MKNVILLLFAMAHLSVAQAESSPKNGASGDCEAFSNLHAAPVVLRDRGQAQERVESLARAGYRDGYFGQNVLDAKLYAINYIYGDGSKLDRKSITAIFYQRCMKAKGYD